MIYRKKKEINPIHINCDRVKINEIDLLNFLGIVFNNKLTYSNHMSMVSVIISKITFVLKRSNIFNFKEY